MSTQRYNMCVLTRMFISGRGGAAGGGGGGGG